MPSASFSQTTKIIGSIFLEEALLSNEKSWCKLSTLKKEEEYNSPGEIHMCQSSSLLFLSYLRVQALPVFKSWFKGILLALLLGVGCAQLFTLQLIQFLSCHRLCLAHLHSDSASAYSQAGLKVINSSVKLHHKKCVSFAFSEM